jgi:hypothetical protein
MKKKTFKPYQTMTATELYELFLGFNEWRETLFSDSGKGYTYMPTEDEPEYYLCVHKLLKIMNLRDWTEADGMVFTKDSHWQFIRSIWKYGLSDEEIIEMAKTISERWGDFERRGCNK